MMARTVAALTIGLTATSQGPAPSDADWRWLDGARKPAFDALMPMTPRPELVFDHPNLHRFVIDLVTARMDVTLADDDAPLVVWAAQAIAAVQRCGAA